MSVPTGKNFMCGVVEGFYGRPWTFAQRHRLIGWLKKFGLNTYCHAPKDDLKHRVLWRELLDTAESDEFEKLIEECRLNNIQFIYSISPGWDDHYGATINRFDPHDLVLNLKRRFEQLLQIGCRAFAIQFDDVPDLSVEQRHQLALWHAQTCNELYRWLNDIDPEFTLFMCPAVYCSAMANGKIGECDYLQPLGAQLDRDVQIWWTGPDIISESISMGHLDDVARVLKRPPLIWDNLNANDYDPARPQMGPYSNRTSDLLQLTTGVLLNPNVQFELNFVPLHTLGSFIDGNEGDRLEEAINAWLPEWERIMGAPFPADLVRLVTDCFSLPFENGPGAKRLLHESAKALSGDDAARQDVQTAGGRLARLFHDLATLRNRDLLDALWSPVWRLKDELELICQLAAKSADAPQPLPDFPHGVVRGGLVAQLQDLIHVTQEGYQVRR